MDYPTKCRAKAVSLHPEFSIRLSINLILDFVRLVFMFPFLVFKCVLKLYFKTSIYWPIFGSLTCYLDSSYSCFLLLFPLVIFMRGLKKHSFWNKTQLFYKMYQLTYLLSLKYFSQYLSGHHDFVTIRKGVNN